MHPHPGAAPRTHSRVRYVGVDIARFLAIAGMMAAHLITIVEWDPNASDAATAAADITNVLTEGIAAPLFAVLGGLSSVFATRNLLRDHRVGAAVGAVALRGAILIGIGLLLGLIENPIVVVLAYYGAAMILVAPLIAARGWIVAAFILLLGIGGGVVNAHIRAGLAITSYEGRSVTLETFGSDGVMAIRALLVTGNYPAITWAAYLLGGVLIGRMLVTAAGRGRLAGVAAVLATAGTLVTVAAQLFSNLVLRDPVSFGFDPLTAPIGLDVDGSLNPERLGDFVHGAPPSPGLWAQLIAMPHSGSPLDIARTLGISCAVIGALVLLCDRGAGHAAGNVWNRGIPGAIRAAGAAPLTLYALHVITAGWLLGPIMHNPLLVADLPWWSVGVGAFALHLTAALGIGAILSSSGRRGPLEALISGTVRLAVRGQAGARP